MLTVVPLAGSAGGSAVHLENEIRDAFAGGFDGAPAGGRLQDQHGDGLARRFLDQRPRARTADLLIGGRQYHDRPFGPRILEGKGGLNDAGLHVVAPRAGDAIAVDPVGQPRQRAFRPHRVVMTQQHDRLSAVAKPDLQVVAGIGSPMSDGGDARALPEELGHLVRARIAARLVWRGGLRPDQAFQGGEHGSPVGPLHPGVVHAKT